MESNEQEADELRRKIQFLESLISSANIDKNNTRGRIHSSNTSYPPSNHSGSFSQHQKYNKPYSNSGYNFTRNTRTHSDSGYNSQKSSSTYSWRKSGQFKHHERNVNVNVDYKPSASKSNSDYISNEERRKRFLLSQEKSKTLPVTYKKNEVDQAGLSKQESKMVEGRISFSDSETTKLNNKSCKSESCNSNKYRSMYRWNRNSEAIQKADISHSHVVGKQNNTSKPVEKRLTVTEKTLKDISKIDSRGKISTEKCSLTVHRNKLGASNTESVSKTTNKIQSYGSQTYTSSSLDAIKSKGVGSTPSCQSNPRKDTASSKHESLCQDIIKTQTKLLELKKSLLEKRQKSKLPHVPQARKDHRHHHHQNHHYHQAHRKDYLQSKGKSKHDKLSTLYSSSYKMPYKTHQQLGYKKYSKYQPYKSRSYMLQKSHYWKPYPGFMRSHRGLHYSGYDKYKHRTHPTYFVEVYTHTGRRPYIQHHYFMKKPFNWQHQMRKQHMISKMYLKRRIEKQRRLQDKVPFDPKMKLDRRKTAVRTNLQNFVMINGMLYKRSKKSLVKATSSKSTDSQNKNSAQQSSTQHKIKFLNTTAMKTVTVRGVKFKVDRDGKSLRRQETKVQTENSAAVSARRSSCVSRVDIGGVTFRQTQPGTLERVTTKKNRVIATRVLNKSVVHATSKTLKTKQKSTKQQQYCMFYNRFGKCNRQDKCPYIHDPDRIAVCTRFLRGTCQIKNCPFSHKVSAEKMPVCSYYLKGVCNKSDCPYLHVNVNRDAEVCQDFVDGFCALGKKCKKKHTLICPVFIKTGSCPDGKKCKLQHRKTKKVKKRETPESFKSETTTLSEKELSEPVQEDPCDTDLPFKERRLPAYISLTVKSKDDTSSDVSGTSNTVLKGTESLKIRPQFGKS